MLYEFLTSNRKELIKRCTEKAARRFAPSEIPSAAGRGIPIFLQQLVDTLRLEQLALTPDVSEPEPASARTEIGRTAALHGAKLLRLGFSVDRVVHNYGDVCQAVTELAGEQNSLISNDEFRTLNRCLDNAIADAVTSFGHAGQESINDQAATLHQRLSSFSDEQRRLVDIAVQAYSAIKTGNVGLTGATGTLLMHALEELRSLAERILPEIRTESMTRTLAAPLTANAL
jgi:hypothetical protein